MMAGKCLEIKDLIREDWWWVEKYSYFHSLSQELFACWLYLKVYPKYSTRKANFPPFLNEPINTTKPEELVRSEIIDANKIVPWLSIDRKQPLEKFANSLEINKYRKSIFFDHDESVDIFTSLRNNPELIVDTEFIKALNMRVYNAYPFGFDVRRNDSFLNLSIVSHDMFILYSILSKLKINKSNKEGIAYAKDMVRMAETCVSHHLITDSNLLIGYWIKWTEERKPKAKSGDGQKNAEIKKQAELRKIISDIFNGDIPPEIEWAKGYFERLLRNAFHDDYPKDRRTIKKYKAHVESKLKTKIKFKK